MASFNLEKVIREMGQGNKAALDLLFKHYYPKLYGFSKGFLKIEDDIDDILQEVFIKLWINREKIRGSDTFNAYIFTITKNLLINYLQAKLKKETFKANLYQKALAEEYLTDNLAEYNEIKDCVDSTISKLPPKRQQIFSLSRKGGLSNKEIAKKMDISIKTVEDHITHSIKYIKEELKKSGFLYLLYFYLFL